MLHIDGLRVGYGGEPVIEDLDLTLAAGQVASLVGPSGSGKSTLLRSIAELHEPDGGRIERAIAADEVGFLFQDDALLPWRTAAQNVALGLRIRGSDKGEALEIAESWLARMGVGGLGARYPRQLSGGQRKRVAIAQVLALAPRMLLMDEPFASLDAIVRHRVVGDLLGWVEQQGIAVLLVTHDLEEAIALADRVHLLPAGPRAAVYASYEVPIPRPRDPVAARAEPVFGELLTRLWRDLSQVSAAGDHDRSEEFAR